MKSKKNLKIGITGSHGFIGGHISAILKNQGARLSFFNLPENNLLEPRLEVIKKFVQNNDVIVHTAAVNRGSNSEVISGNIIIAYNLLSAIVKYKSRAKLIFLSSIQTETETLYGLSKRLTEIMLKDFSEHYKIPVSIFRLTNVFGEGCKPFYNSVVATFCYQTANGKELTVNTESKNKKINLIYVGDTAQIIARESLIRRKNLFYFQRICSKNEITVANLAKLIESFRADDSKKLKSKFYKDLYKTYLSYGE